MKIACIGDVHGESRWKEVTTQIVDHFVFVGDYVDSDHLADDEIWANLQEILAFKLSQPEKVTLLLGNHDLQYMFWPRFRWLR